MTVALFPIEEVWYTVESNNDQTLNVVEKMTGHRIYNNVSKNEAATILVGLNLMGRGFNGWTPSFCLKKKLPKFNVQDVA